jgi:uridylate kinase
MFQEKRIIISLGGSLLVPDAIDTVFVQKFKDFIVSYIEKGYSFILVTGGGRTARTYIDAAAQTTEITDDDKDWLGIHATRLNGHFIRTVFREYAHPRINTNPHDLEDFYHAQEPILVAAGWRPGRSTDFCAVLLGKYLDVKQVINLSNVDCAYDRDPRQFPDAKKIERATWQEFREIVGSEWSPGMSAPFDPIASKMAQEEEMEVAIMNGSDLDNLGHYLDGELFQGTVVKG